MAPIPGTAPKAAGNSHTDLGSLIYNVRFGSCVTSIAGPNGMRNCTGDEGRPFGVGNQVLVSSHRKLLSSKAMVVSCHAVREMKKDPSEPVGRRNAVCYEASL